MRTAAAVAVAALLVTGCGIGAPPAARPPADVAGIWHRYAQCVRDHGQPAFPDPTVDDQGHAQLPDGVHVTREASEACASTLDALPAAVRVRKTDFDPATMRRFARCMRDNGIEDWPDPDDQGVFHFPSSLAGDMKTNPRWTRIQAAWQGPCLRYDPTGQIGSAAK